MAHGVLPARSHPCRNARTHRNHGAIGRAVRPLRSPLTCTGQALHGRCGRQNQFGGGAAARSGRHHGREDVGARLGLHRRHGRQARIDPRLPHRAACRRDAHHRAAGGLLPGGSIGAVGACRQKALRPARRHRHHREHPADCRQHHEQEVGGRGGAYPARCEGGRGRPL
jgi:hypothetical protein